MAALPLTCPKCDGCGILMNYRHIDNGRCFGCAGTGRLIPSDRKAPRAKVVEDKVIRSSRYPGWLIRKAGGAAYTMQKGNATIFVSQPDGKNWRAWIDMGDPGFGQFDSVADAIAALS